VWTAFPAESPTCFAKEGYYHNCLSGEWRSGRVERKDIFNPHTTLSCLRSANTYRRSQGTAHNDGVKQATHIYLKQKASNSSTNNLICSYPFFSCIKYDSGCFIGNGSWWSADRSPKSWSWQHIKLNGGRMSQSGLLSTQQKLHEPDLH